MIKKLAHNVLQHLGILSRLRQYQRELDKIKILVARGLIAQMKSAGPQDNICNFEFSVFSQWGDDGIIQYLVHRLGIVPHSFVEFGVENYLESNTRFLLINNNWRGLVIDASKENVDCIKKDEIYWKYDLTAVCAHVTMENINRTLVENGFEGDIGILSIDVDGNDYWIWSSIDVINPTLVIIEYNSFFGEKRAVTIPYEPEFVRTKAHYSTVYWGASLKALCFLAGKKGYVFVGSNSNGNNAYFVRKDRSRTLKVQSPESGYVKARYREARDRHGQLIHVSGEDALKTIGDMPIYDVENETTVRISDLF